MSKIIDTPIRLELVENKIYLDEYNSVTEIMENNSYEVKIHTNEFLDGCSLVMKRYGDNELKEIDKNLRFETVRLITISKLLQNSVEYWGILKLYVDDKLESTINDTYRAELYQYNTYENVSEVPTLFKKESVYLEKIGEIFGKIEYEPGVSTEQDESDYKFIPTELKYVSGFGTDIEFDSDLEKRLQQIIFTTSKDTSLIPNPPQIDDMLQIPDSISFSSNGEKAITFITEDNESFNLNFIEFKLDFASYDEENGFYYFKKTVEFTDIEPLLLLENKKITVINDFLSISDVSFKYNDISEKAGESENYSKVSGLFTIILKFLENDFSTYEFEIQGDINFTIEAEIPKKIGDKFYYKIPKKNFITEQIQAVEIDGTGEVLIDKENSTIPALVYETDTEGNFILDKNGLKIPVYKTSINLVLNEEANAVRAENLEEPILKYIPVYETDTEGNLVYEEMLIPKFARDEDGIIQINEFGEPIYIYLDEDQTQIDYERNFDGSYIYDKQLKPVYELDENGERIVEDGEYKIIYEIDDEGKKIPDPEAKTYLYEKDADGNLILNENGIKIPIYQKTLGFALNKEGNVEQEINSEILITNYVVSYEKDSNGNIIYENILIPKYERDENKKLILDENNNPIYIYLDEEKTEIDYEKHLDGSYIYDKQPLPIYELNENAERIIENGEYKVAYETDGTGLPKRDENGQLIFAYEKDNEGNILFDEETGAPIPIYEKNEDGTIRKEVKQVTFLTENDEVIFEEGEFDSNLLPKYKKKTVNDIEYYEATLISENNYELYPIIENGNPIYEINSEGEFETIEKSKQVMILGEVEEVTELNYTTINNIGEIFYTNFSYTQLDVNKEEFILENVEENNIYTAVIDKRWLPDYTEKILLGIVKYEGEGDNREIGGYATNAVEIIVGRSISTITWEPDETFANQKYIVAKYDSNSNLFYEITSAEENKQYLSGRENYLFVDYNKLQASSSEELLYKWNPEIGFYPITAATNKQIITD